MRGVTGRTIAPLAEGQAAGFGFFFEDVRAAVGQDGVRRLGERGAQAELVSHCAGDGESGGFVAGAGGPCQL